MRAFYVTSFGGQSGSQYHNPRTGLRSYFIALGEGCRIELMERPGVAVRPEGSITGYAHLALSLGSREAVDETVAVLGKRGVRSLRPPPRPESRGLEAPGSEIELGPALPPRPFHVEDRPSSREIGLSSGFEGMISRMWRHHRRQTSVCAMACHRSSLSSST